MDEGRDQADKIAEQVTRGFRSDVERIMGSVKTDYRENLAVALFEARYGASLRMWSDETRDYWLRQADAIATTPPAAPPVDAVPAGWRLVPIEPTEAMLFAAYRCGDGGSPKTAYDAMLVASPTAPEATAQAGDGDPDGWLAVKVNSEGGIVMPYGPLHPHPDRPNDVRYKWAPFYLGDPA